MVTWRPSRQKNKQTNEHLIYLKTMRTKANTWRELSVRWCAVTQTVCAVLYCDPDCLCGNMQWPRLYGDMQWTRLCGDMQLPRLYVWWYAVTQTVCVVICCDPECPYGDIQWPRLSVRWYAVTQTVCTVIHNDPDCLYGDMQRQTVRVVICSDPDCTVIYRDTECLYNYIQGHRVSVQWYTETQCLYNDIQGHSVCSVTCDDPDYNAMIQTVNTVKCSDSTSSLYVAAIQTACLVNWNDPDTLHGLMRKADPVGRGSDSARVLLSLQLL